jgi:hypothetical protein
LEQVRARFVAASARAWLSRVWFLWRGVSFVAAMLILLLCARARIRGDEQDHDGERVQKKPRVQVVT